MAYKLEKPYTDFERADFIVEYNHKRGMLIEETEDGTLYALEKNEIMINDVPEINQNYEEELARQKENLFYQELVKILLALLKVIMICKLIYHLMKEKIMDFVEHVKYLKEKIILVQ